MAALRLLSQLLLVASGTTLGAFTISGYFEPHLVHGQPVVAAAGIPMPSEKSPLAIARPRKRFVAIDAKTSSKPAAAKVAKPAPKKSQVARERRPQQAATQMPWPWGLFNN